jgi:hypothetical protein
LASIEEVSPIESESTVGAAEALNNLANVSVCVGFDDSDDVDVDEIAPTVIMDNTVAVGTGLPLVAMEDGMEMDDVAAESGALKEPVIPSSLGARRLEMCTYRNRERDEPKERRESSIRLRCIL